MSEHELVSELKALHACFERGLERDRTMHFNVNGNGSGSSTGFSIDHRLLWRAAEFIRKNDIDRITAERDRLRKALEEAQQYISACWVSSSYYDLSGRGRILETIRAALSTPADADADADADAGGQS